MRKIMRHNGGLGSLFVVAAALLLAACASIGRPEGGPRDITPPVVVSSTPAPGSVNVSNGRIDIVFDENITLDEPMNKIVVSPPQKKQAQISSNGRRVRITLRDTLRDSTTYTVDLADAVRDLNEGNILDGLAIDFSTGPSIDTLMISGIVFEGRTLEPAQGMIVGVYSTPVADTALTTLPMDRITKTNALGRFTIRNLKPGSYRVFAINDLNHDFHWDRSEDIAFLDRDISPSTMAVEVTDTFTDAAGNDSLVTRPATRFLPDDILLTWFNENYKPLYLVKHERPDARRLTLEMSTHSDSLPQLTLLNTVRAGARLDREAVLQSSPGLDSLTYWLRDTTLIGSDTLKIAARYLHTDTLDNITFTTDTLTFALRQPKKKKKRDEETDSVPKLEFVNIGISSRQPQDLNIPLLFETSAPTASIDSAGFRIEELVDSVWMPVAARIPSPPDSLQPMRLLTEMTWKPKTKYRVTIDSLAVTDIYGNHNRPFVQEVSTHAIEDYAALFFNIGDLGPDSAIVELLSSDKPVRLEPVRNGVATFEYVTPGAYYARLFIDRNQNGRWDTGSVADTVQPEDVFYFSKKLNLKKNWDVEQQWNIYETPVDLQKPEDIKKNKPPRPKWETEEEREKRKKGNNDDEEEEFDPFMNDPFAPQSPDRLSNSNRRNRPR
ncbi:MAG: Ig-like domain-containing protein [Prevotella sp.]|nr:Ig-like domain-containing protein [Prevotella sp.]